MKKKAGTESCRGLPHSVRGLVSSPSLITTFRGFVLCLASVGLGELPALPDVSGSCAERFPGGPTSAARFPRGAGRAAAFWLRLRLLDIGCDWGWTRVGRGPSWVAPALLSSVCGVQGQAQAPVRPAVAGFSLAVPPWVGCSWLGLHLLVSSLGGHPGDGVQMADLTVQPLCQEVKENGVAPHSHAHHPLGGSPLGLFLSWVAPRQLHSINEPAEMVQLQRCQPACERASSRGATQVGHRAPQGLLAHRAQKGTTLPMIWPGIHPISQNRV